MEISDRRGVECKYVEIVSEVAPDGRKAGGKWTWSERGKSAEMAEMAEMGRYQTPPLRGAYHTPARRL